MITVGSVSRDKAARLFPFLAPDARDRRAALREFAHRDPELVFWVSPDGDLGDARHSPLQNPPRNFARTLGDEPDYGGFLRGRVVRSEGHQLVIVHCRPEALEADGPQVKQLLTGLTRAPVPIDEGALVISDNTDIYGTIGDLRARAG
jgi:hypothetical protein